MHSWSGEGNHTERNRLLSAVAEVLGESAPPLSSGEATDVANLADHEALELVELVFYYCARALEFQRQQRGEAPHNPDLLGEVRESFQAILDRVRPPEFVGTPDTEGLLHHVLDGFDEQLELLAPDPNRVR